ncbi:MAG: DUF4340 domain-containing protein [Firmicutes bacterium]|nr:DUF4340 domain-containing protein [Bacillota bacterium]
MKRNQKLLIMLGALVALVCVALVLTDLDLNGEYEEETEAELIEVFSVDADDITALSWTNDDTTLSFTVTEDGWVWDDDPAFPLDSSYLESMAQTVCQIDADREIGEAEDLSEYGLDEPQCTITVTTADGSTEIWLGDESTSGGSRYLCLGDSMVYLAEDSLLDAFDYALYDMITVETIPDMSDISVFQVDALTQTLTLTYQEGSTLTYSDEYVWFAGEQYLDTELTEDFVGSITGLSWLECVNYNADADALADYGLDEPTAVVTVSYTQTVETATNETDEDGNTVYTTEELEGTFCLHIGDYGDDDDCYARIEGSSMVYRIDASISDALLYTTVAELLPDEVLAMDLDTLTAIDLILDGETYHVEKSTVTVTDDDGNTSEETVWTMDDTEVDMDDILSALEDVEASGYATGLTPERSEELRLVLYRDHETYPQVELAFYQYDSSQCITQLMGQSTVFAVRSDVVSLVEAVNALILG